MARTELPVVLRITNSDGYNTDIQVAKVEWKLTYKGKLARIRTENINGFRYKKSSWTTKQTGLTRVARLSKLYNDYNFGLIEVRA